MRSTARGDVRTGVALAAVTALISGVSVWVNAFGVSQVPDAILYTTLKNGVAAAILLVALLVAARGRPAAPAIRPSRGSLGAVIGVGLLGGGVAFVLFFSGLAQTTATGAAFIQKTLFVWVALLAVPFLGERLGLAQLGALIALVVGQVLLAAPRAAGWGGAETLVLIATLIWAAEVVVARRLLATIPALALGVARLGIGLVVLGGAVVAGGRLDGIAAIGALGWAMVGLTGILLAAYVATWFAALQRAPATLVTSILVGGALVTAVLQAVTSGRAPQAGAVVGGIVILAAVALLVRMAMVRRPRVLATDAG